MPQNHWVDWTPVSSSQIHPLKAYWIHDQPLTTDLVSWTEKTSETVDMVEFEGNKLKFFFFWCFMVEQMGMVKLGYTPWNGWLEDDAFSFRMAYFQVRAVSSQAGNSDSILTHLNESFKFPLIRSPTFMLLPRMWREDRVEPSCLTWVNHQQYGNPPGFSQRFCQRFFFLNKALWKWDVVLVP